MNSTLVFFVLLPNFQSRLTWKEIGEKERKRERQKRRKREKKERKRKADKERARERKKERKRQRRFGNMKALVSFEAR